MHVRLNGCPEVILDAVIMGNAAHEVVDYFEFQADNLLAQFRRDFEAALCEGKIGYEESGRLLRFYEAGLHG
jgi:arginine decarboxylase